MHSQALIWQEARRRIKNGSTDTESLKIEDGSSLLGEDLVSWRLEPLSKRGVPEAHGKGRSIAVDMENRG